MKLSEDKEKKSIKETEEKVAEVNKRAEQKIKEAKKKAAEATAKAEKRAKEAEDRKHIADLGKIEDLAEEKHHLEKSRVSKVKTAVESESDSDDDHLAGASSFGQKVNALNQKYHVKSALSNQEKLYNNLQKYGSFDVENVNQMSQKVETTFPGILSQKLKMYMKRDHEDGSPDYSPGDWNFENHPYPQEINYHDPEPL